MGNAEALARIHEMPMPHAHELAGMITASDEELRQAYMQIEALTLANSRKDEFLAMLSHELRSPLASVGHAVRLLGKHPVEDPTQRRIQSLVERQIGRLNRIADELLDVSRITSGKLHLQRHRVNLCDVVSHAIETLKWDLQERHHALEIELPDTPVWLQADAVRLEQVFVNLLANACRFTEPGGQLRVHVGIDRDQAAVRIRDSGIGVEADELPHIFDLFRQGIATERRATSGLGVGLAVVRNLVELHRGSVTAVSGGAGQGSEFTVFLPTTSSCHMEIKTL
jgi:signal transduction histidine kinase